MTWTDGLPLTYDGTISDVPWRLAVEMTAPPVGKQWAPHPTLSVESGSIGAGGGGRLTFDPTAAPQVEGVRLSPGMIIVGGTCTKATDRVEVALRFHSVRAVIVRSVPLPVNLFVAVVHATPLVITCWDGNRFNGCELEPDWIQ